jgi:hypothetical protein
VKPISSLRVALVAQWALGLASVLLFELEAPGLPEALREYYIDTTLEPATRSDQLVGAFAAVWGVACIVASFGVFFLKHWARAAYLTAVAMGVILQGLLEPSITSAWSETAESAAEVLAGVVIGLLYFLPLDANAPSRPRSE